MNCCDNEGINATTEEIKALQKKYLLEAYPDGTFEYDGKKYAILIDGN